MRHPWVLASDPKGGRVALDPIVWALKDAPVQDIYEKAVLWVFAEKADEDGTNSFPSLSTVARLAMCDVQTVKDRLRKLVRRGLLKLAEDQSPASYLPAHARPRVYELMIPYSWYGKPAIERVNEARVARGLPPLTPESRPDLAPAPPRKRRADAKPRTSKKGGGVQDPPVDSAEDHRGGVYDIPPGGMYNTPRGGVYNTPQPSPITLPNDPPLPRATAEQSGSARATAAKAGRVSASKEPQQPKPRQAAAGGHAQDPTPTRAAAPVGSGSAGDKSPTPDPAPDPAAVKLVDTITWPPHIHVDSGSRRNLISAASRCLAAGWPAAAVQAEIEASIPRARSVGPAVRNLCELANRPRRKPVTVPQRTPWWEN